MSEGSPTKMCCNDLVKRGQCRLSFVWKHFSSTKKLRMQSDLTRPRILERKPTKQCWTVCKDRIRSERTLLTDVIRRIPFNILQLPLNGLIRFISRPHTSMLYLFTKLVSLIHSWMFHLQAHRHQPHCVFLLWTDLTQPLCATYLSFSIVLLSIIIDMSKLNLHYHRLKDIRWRHWTNDVYYHGWMGNLMHNSKSFFLNIFWVRTFHWEGVLQMNKKPFFSGWKSQVASEVADASWLSNWIAQIWWGVQ